MANTIIEFDSKLLKVVQETRDVKTFRFSAPDEFEFRPGQYVTVEMDVDGKKDKRFFSISSSPTKRGFIEITKKIGESDFSKKLGSMKEGFTVRVKGPYGVFVFDEKELDYVLLAGGIGVTPFRCFIEYVNDKELNNRIALFYSNKTPEDIAFKDEMDRIARKNKNIKIIATVTRPEESKEGWNGAVGRIDENMIRQHANADGAIFYICGPPLMVDTMIDTVRKMGIPQNRIKFERFLGY